MEEWTTDEWGKKLEQHEQTAFFLYTPLCGTCDVSLRMLKVVESLLPDLPIGMANINYLGNAAYDLKIESVPCLLVSNKGEITEKIYAFKSVPFLYEILKNN